MTPFLASRQPPPSPASADHVVLVTHDQALVSEVRRLAAAAGTTLDVLTSVADLRPRWSTTPVVLLGADTVTEVVAAAPPRRDRVHVLARRALPDGLFRDALAVGAQSVVELPAAETWLVETLTDAADGTTRRAVVVGVVGGCGGAGATTFATALALAAATVVHPVTLVDVDPLGAGIEQVVGLDDADGSGWSSLLESVGRLGSRSLRAALPRREGLAVLGWGDGARHVLEPRVAREAVSAAQRGCSLVVVDLPRYTDPASLEVLVRVDELVVVTPMSLAGVAASARVVTALLPLVARAHLVTRGRESALDPEDVAAALGVPLAAAMTDQRRLEESVELGLGPLASRRGPLARAARATLARTTAQPGAVA